MAPISLLAYSPLLILGKDAIPPNSAKELIAWLKCKKIARHVWYRRHRQVPRAAPGAVSFAKAIGVKFDYRAVSRRRPGGLLLAITVPT